MLARPPLANLPVDLTNSFLNSLYLRRIGKQPWGGSFIVLLFNNVQSVATISYKQYELLGNVTFLSSAVNIKNGILV